MTVSHRGVVYLADSVVCIAQSRQLTGSRRCRCQTVNVISNDSGQVHAVCLLGVELTERIWLEVLVAIQACVVVVS